MFGQTLKLMFKKNTCFKVQKSKQCEEKFFFFFFFNSRNCFTTYRIILSNQFCVIFFHCIRIWHATFLGSYTLNVQLMPIFSNLKWFTSRNKWLNSITKQNDIDRWSTLPFVFPNELYVYSEPYNYFFLIENCLLYRKHAMYSNSYYLNNGKNMRIIYWKHCFFRIMHNVS